MPRVFIPNQGAHYYSPAKMFGTIEFLTEGLLDPVSRGKMYRVLDVALKDSDDTDYLMISSLSILSSVAASILAFKHGRVNFLLYKEGKYVQRTIVLNQQAL